MATMVTSPPPEAANQRRGREPAAVFVYGSLMAEELLCGLLRLSEYPNDENGNEHEKQRQRQRPHLRRERAILHGFRRVPVKHDEYPALIRSATAQPVAVEGYL